MPMSYAPFNGQLNANEVYAAIYNMIISQQVFANPIKGTYGSLAERFRRDGSMYGDTKLFYSVQIGKVEDWNGDAEAANLLALNRAPAPYCQAVPIDVKKKIWLTVDNFLSKRAWGTEGAFSQFNSVILGTIRDTKRVYEATMMNTYIGTQSTAVGSQNLTVTLASNSNAESQNRMDAQTVAQAIADLMINIEDVTTDYNDLGYLRSYNKSDFILVMNASWANKITFIDIPTIYNDESIKQIFAEAKLLPAHYFGTVNTTTKTTADANTYSLIEQDSGATHYRAGQKIPTSTSLSGLQSYQVNANIVGKLVHKDAIQYMSGFETATEFFNPRSLTNNHYLIFMHSNLQNSRLKEFPFITITASRAS